VLVAVGVMTPIWSAAADAPEREQSHESNRYLGLTVGSTGTPYIGSDRNLWLFPIFRTFADSATTDDLIVSRDGSIGLRWLHGAGLQYGVFARLQNLGYSASDNPALAGMQSRNQTLELGPLIGYRIHHFQVDLTYYADVLGVHNGAETRLVISFPFEVAHRFFIGHLDVYRQSADMANYYFGVLPGEAAPGRPAYAPGGVTNFSIGIRTGWHLGKRFALFLDATHEYFDHAVENSPIVDSRNAWTLSVGAGYNF